MKRPVTIFLACLWLMTACGGPATDGGAQSDESGTPTTGVGDTGSNPTTAGSNPTTAGDTGGLDNGADDSCDASSPYPECPAMAGPCEIECEGAGCFGNMIVRCDHERGCREVEFCAGAALCIVRDGEPICPEPPGTDTGSDSSGSSGGSDSGSGSGSESGGSSTGGSGTAGSSG